MTPVLAAGFNSVAETYDVSTQFVAYTTGFYMLGLGVGSVVMSPTAILYGKRPIYLLGATFLILSAVWCALSPNYTSLAIARVFQGIAVSPVECLPSASIAEIYFLHERAYRIGIYTLLLLGGKNLIPLVSAAIINSMGWRWVFWIVAIVTGGCFLVLFFFVPETFWDRSPRPRRHHKRPHLYRSVSNIVSHGLRGRPPYAERLDDDDEVEADHPAAPKRPKPVHHVGFANQNEKIEEETGVDNHHDDRIAAAVPTTAAADHVPETDKLSPSPQQVPEQDLESTKQGSLTPTNSDAAAPGNAFVSATVHYTNCLRERPPIPFAQYLKPWTGRIAHDQWIRVATRPFILFAYPAVLWSTAVYALSVGWLIIMSELVSHIYQGGSYNFTSLQAGLVYISPFVGGLIGTAVAGKVSDIIAKYMTRCNGGIYEPEFRLVMGIPIALSTTIGLMAFGWSAEEEDAWIVPTIFFGVVSFGCCLGSTTAITYCVDSYRQYAGEALVTLNWSKSTFRYLPSLSHANLQANNSRHLPRPRLLPVRSRLDGIRRRTNGIPSPGRNPARLFTIHDPDVHLREAGADVDSPEALDGEFLISDLYLKCFGYDYGDDYDYDYDYDYVFASARCAYIYDVMSDHYCIWVIGLWE